MTEALEQHERAYAYCAYCPKVCRFSCPVSEVTRSETTSTWGKMTQAYLLQSQEGLIDQGAAEALYACTGCMRCRSFCAHENEVGSALFAARELALKKERGPAGAVSTVRTFREHGNPFGPASATGPSDANRAFAGAAGMALFPGCTTLIKCPQLLQELRAVADEFSSPFQLAEGSGRCCGYPLYAAGAASEFREYAEGMTAAMGKIKELAVLDPGCAYTFSVLYPRHGIAWKTRIRTVTSLLAERIPSRVPAPLAREVSYFDACHLGRGLGEYEPPRSLLRRAVQLVREAADSRREAGCSGGGGLLPRTMPEVSAQMAQRLGSNLLDQNGTIAVACTTALRQFEKAGHSAQHLISILQSWVCR